MGRASSNKRIARAARAAGRDTEPKQARALAWPLAMVAVVGLGGVLIFFSVGERAEASAPLLGDHWHAAYGISVCGEFLPPLGDAQQDTSGIHTHSDGLVHIHPFSTRYTGDGATLGAFAGQVGLTLEDDRLDLPGSGEFANGGDCAGEPAEVQVKVWDGVADVEGRLLDADLAGYAPPDGSLVTIAFAPVGADLAKPPSAGTVPDDLPGAAPVGGSPAPGATTPSTAPAEGSTTNGPEGATPPEGSVGPDATTDPQAPATDSSVPEATSTSGAP